MKIPFLNFEPQHALVKMEMTAAFEEVYASNWFIMGKRLVDFEMAYAHFNGTKFAIGVSNGLDALYLSLKALGIGEGDEVIVPSNTYIATALAVSYTGATPVFVEPDILTYNLSVEHVRKAITLKTKAIMPVHLYGQACEMDELMKLAHSHGLFIVEDNAQAHGATFNGQMTGSFGILNGVSFYPGKNLGALGDAGAITTNNFHLAQKIFSLRNYGSQTKYKNEIIGHNMRLDELQAAFLCVKLKHLEQWTAQRQEIASWYQSELEGTGDLVLPYIHPGATHVFHLYVVRTAYRNELQNYLSDAEIGSLIHYPIPPHLQEAYQVMGFKKGDFPVAEELAATSLSLPLWPGMSRAQVSTVCETIKAYFNEG